MRRICLAFLALLTLSWGALAQQLTIEDARTRLDQTGQILSQVEASFARNDLSEAQLVASRSQIEPLPDVLNAVMGDLGPRLAEVKARLDQLGPPPAAGQPAESPGVSAESRGLASQKRRSSVPKI